ncbi:PIG-L deacetylase family protein [Streptomyces pinistramenti]|uniref:PIG-L deacetylase family protein n=1 Tax=Streptomyces pinistramenti TaxID=2884812 RepID=UPI001D074070|nr:PIG-L family deacetylase [Streptomyces pinistramenti]MCB5909750.1 PIG-L family deacetylase [Streptomyces pinistramenti]
MPPESAPDILPPLAAMPDDWQRALAIVAHPDDLEYGAAAAIAEWTAAGREVGYLLVTRGEAGIDGLAPERCATVREAEQRAGAALVGVDTVEFLDHPDGVIEATTALRRDLAAAVRRHRPELLVTLNHHDTWGGVHWNTPDHRVVGRAALDAAGDAGNRWIFPELATEQGLAPWNGVRWVAVAGSPYPTHAAEVGPGIDRAVDSLAAHRTYIQGLAPTHQDPHTYARAFLTPMLQAGATRHRGRPATLFEVFPR